MSDHDLPAPVDQPPATLTEPQRKAWRVLADGGRIRDAAAAAGAPISTVWAWRRTSPTFRAALEARYAALHDTATETMETAMARATPDADARDIGNALRAAGMVQRGLGIGVPLGGGNAPAHATAVSVTVNLAGALAAGPDGPSIDVPCAVGVPSLAEQAGPVVDAPPSVASTQPRRSVTSRRRRTRHD